MVQAEYSGRPENREKGIGMVLFCIRLFLVAVFTGPVAEKSNYAASNHQAANAPAKKKKTIEKINPDISVFPSLDTLPAEAQEIAKKLQKECVTEQRWHSRALVYRIRTNDKKQQQRINVEFQYGLTGSGGTMGSNCLTNTFNVFWMSIDCNFRLRADLPGYHQLERKILAEGSRILVLDDLELEPVTPDNQATLTGTVHLEDDADPSGIRIRTGKYTVTTDASGKFFFPSMGSGVFTIYGHKDGYLGMHETVNLKRKESQNITLHGYRERLAVVRWAYQPNESRNLTGKDLIEGFAVLRANGLDRVSFKEGFVNVNGESDFGIRQKEEKLILSHSDGGREEGQYMVVKNRTMDDVVHAPGGEYRTRSITLAQGDVYVIKCWGHRNYGKMEVLALIEDGRSEAEALAMIKNPSCILPLIKANYQFPSLAVIDLDSADCLSESESQAITDLARDLIQRSERYIIVDRESMIHILGEEDFVASVKCDNTRCMVNYGRKLRAQKMMHGRISKAGHSFILSLKMLDVSSGVIDAQVTRRIKGNIDELLNETEDVACALLRQVFK